MARFTAQRFHDISCGHRVAFHEGKCAHLHGHNYRIHFTIAPRPQAGLDHIGRVLDFSVIKSLLCAWLESNWDHRFLLWSEDPQAVSLYNLDPAGVVLVPFNPTAENMAQHLVNVVGPAMLKKDHPDIVLIRVMIEETAKCWATYDVEEEG